MLECWSTGVLSWRQRPGGNNVHTARSVRLLQKRSHLLACLRLLLLRYAVLKLVLMLVRITTYLTFSLPYLTLPTTTLSLLL